MAEFAFDVKSYEEFSIGKGDDIIRISSGISKGEPCLDIRRYYLSDDGKYLPTKKGIFLKVNEEFSSAKTILEAALALIKKSNME